MTRSSNSSPGLCPVDYLFLGYLVLTAPFVAFAPENPGLGIALAMMHLTGAVSIFALGRFDASGGLLEWSRDWYPLLLMFPLYAEVGLVADGLYGQTVRFDHVVSSWDNFLVGDSWYGRPGHDVTGLFWSEFLHFGYLSYYGLIGGGYVAAWLWKRDRFPRFVFVFSGAFLTFLAVFAIFPVHGPYVGGFPPVENAGLFERMVAGLYRMAGASGQLIGAFPSSHVGQAVVVALLLRPATAVGRMALGSLVVLIALSIVLTGVHYIVDAIAGLLAGPLLWFIWSSLYGEFFASERTPTAKHATEATP